MRHWLWRLALVGALTGCASWQNPPASDLVIGKGAVQSYRLEGRIVVRQASGSDSGKLEWQLQRDTEQHVELLSPLGTTVAVVDSSPLESRLVLADQRSFVATDPAALTQSVLGYELPLQGLPWWLRGQPDPTLPAQLERDGDNHLVRLSQQGWVMTYADWRSIGGQWLPGNIRLERENLHIRVKVDRWTLQQQEAE
ncbi:MAG: outer membrane lipoprotein LolB [Ferrovum sp.]|nr:outer membrane lipoprotein LolB [Ferrovum sp.]NDU87886.1 outer membrane lipoprotein LolB [Ferrovum sp.]